MSYAVVIFYKSDLHTETEKRL